MNIMDSDQHGQIVCYKKTQVSAGISPQTVPSIIIKIDPDQLACLTGQFRVPKS